VMALQGRVRGTLVPKPEKPEAKAKKP
jgi:hypothetical protein